MKLVYNGKTLSGGTASIDTLPIRSLTRDEYDALSSEERQDEVIYLITDKEVVPLTSMIEEYDTSDGWHVRKWSDGYVEQILKKVEQIPASDWTKNDEYLYSVGSPHFEAITLPVVLKEKYGEVYSAYAVNWSVFVAHRGLSVSDQKDPLTYVDGFSVYRIGSVITSTLTCTLTVTVTGRWK